MVTAPAMLVESPYTTPITLVKRPVTAWLVANVSVACPTLLVATLVTPVRAMPLLELVA